MKRVMLLIALAVSAALFTSCEKQETINQYSYSHSFHLSHRSDVSAITDILNPKLNEIFEISQAEAEAEWDQFVNMVDESKLVFMEDEYYTVTFSRMEIQGNRLVEAETVGTKTWRLEK